MARLGVSFRIVARRIAAGLRRGRLQQELRDEMRLHMELRRQALIDDGMDAREAEYEARRMFGNVVALGEETRDMWGFAAIDTVGHDLRYGARLLARSPMVTGASVLSLAIGIGASAAVFNLADEMLLRRLPVPAPHQLVRLHWRSGPVFPFSSLNGNASQNDEGLGSTSFSLDAFRQARSRAGGLVDLFGFADLDRVNLSIDGVADLGQAHAVSGNYFSALGISPASGRPLVESDDRVGAAPAAVISDALWRRRFDAPRTAAGRTLAVNGVPFTVVGVLARSFQGTGQVGSSPDVYVPMAARSQIVRSGDDAADPNFWWVLMMGRVRPGVAPERIQPALDLILKQTVTAARPGIKPGDLPIMHVSDGSQGQTEVRESVRDPLQMMSIVVAIVLLVACANVANLLLARGRARLRELSVRIAVGASRRRIVRQLLTEGGLLAACGSVLGLIAARWIAAALLPALDDGPDPLMVSGGLSLRLVGFVAVLASSCVAIFALVPALRATNVSLVAGLYEAGRGSAAGRDRCGLSVSLVVSQIALSMVLVATALLLVRSVQQLRRVDLGFNAGIS